MCPSDREDERVRFGREPAGLEEQRFLEELVPGTDEFRWTGMGRPHSWGEPADEADGDA